MKDQSDRANFLGIDWGSHDIGIALAHAETRIAVPIVTERNDVGLIKRLGHLIEHEAIRVVVIGIPSHVNRQAVEYPGERLGRQLAQEYGVEIAYQDEMFTTKIAQQTLILRGERHVGKKDDAEAARIILQQWLDKKCRDLT